MTNDNENNSFLSACSRGDVEAVKKCLITNDYKNTAYNLSYGFDLACKNGNLKIVKEILKCSKTGGDLKRDCKTLFKQGIMHASEKGHFNIVHYFLTDTDVKDSFTEQLKEEGLFNLACQSGNIKLVKFLLTSSQLPSRYDMSKIGIPSFLAACEAGKIGLIDYFLKTYPQHLGAHLTLSTAFLRASSNNNIHLIKYLLDKNNKSLSGYINIDKNACSSSFKISCYKGHMDIVNFFIFELNIEKTPEIENFLFIGDYKHITALFSARDEKRAIEDLKLPHSSSTSHSSSFKI